MVTNKRTNGSLNERADSFRQYDDDYETCAFLNRIPSLALSLVQIVVVRLHIKGRCMYTILARQIEINTSKIKRDTQWKFRCTKNSLMHHQTVTRQSKQYSTYSRQNRRLNGRQQQMNNYTFLLHTKRRIVYSAFSVHMNG